MPCINRYENYTRGSCSSSQTSGKVLKRCNNQIIKYWLLSIWSSLQWLFLHYRYSQHLHTFRAWRVIILLMRAKCVGPRCMIILRHRYSYNQKRWNLPKSKKFDCVGREDLTSLFKSCEIDRSQGRLVSSVENMKSFTSRPSDLQKLCLMCTFWNIVNLFLRTSNRFSRHQINVVELFFTVLTVD